jgi:hypothetical protein
MQDQTHNSAHKERGNQESEYYQKGYDYQTQVLNRKLDQHVIDSPEAMRAVVSNIAKEADAYIRDQAWDRSLEFDLGQLQAVTDWSHTHNRQLGQKLKEAPALREHYNAGYAHRLEKLNNALASARFSSPQYQRLFIRSTALNASRSVRDNVGDRGTGLQPLEHPEFDRGQRKAIMDWSHQHNHASIAEQFNQGYKQQMNLLASDFKAASSISNESPFSLAERIATNHSKIIRQAYENNSDSKSASNTDYFNYGQRAALRDWKNTHMNAANHSQQSHSTSANSSQEQKTGTTQQVSQQATHSNSQANSNSKDQAQKFNQVQRDYGISY